MKKGYTIVELTIYLVVTSIFLSFLIPSVWDLSDELMFRADVQDAEEMIIYARQISLIKNVMSTVLFKSDNIYVMIEGKTIKERHIKVSKVGGRKEFGFLSGIPYESGKIFLHFKEKKALLTLQPITGVLKIDWE
ncbi:pilus assembly FimT family protein [Mesoaciditoga lauensis]|uniref:pilus assembly FimT family protein n=1 Tax=Mesoaciditoga lauensis TaxID=1495039 RepID=UPI00055B2482|nr:hypothetical protein [Mesoaciditoga lauensis]